MKQAQQLRFLLHLLRSAMRNLTQQSIGGMLLGQHPRVVANVAVAISALGGAIQASPYMTPARCLPSPPTPKGEGSSKGFFIGGNMKGKYFHTFKDGEVCKQGHCLSQVGNKPVYLCQLFSWLSGEPNGTEVIDFRIVPAAFYDSKQEWLAAAEVLQ